MYKIFLILNDYIELKRLARKTFWKKSGKKCFDPALKVSEEFFWTKNVWMITKYILKRSLITMLVYQKNTKKEKNKSNEGS